MLSTPWKQRSDRYDFIIIGSGYGGAITAARLATANLNPKPSVCILERGKEWQPGEFPETFPDVIKETRSDANPLGLYELLNHPDISVIKGSGLGGTSLINANVAILPDREVFEQTAWPGAVRYDDLMPYYKRAGEMLGANQHPRAAGLAKVKALDLRAQQLGGRAEALNIAVNFTIDGINPHGVAQKPCNDCGNCVTGCNVTAKNTLYMNYLPMARQAGATIFTQTKVEWIEKLANGGWRIHGRYYEKKGRNRKFTMDAAHVVLSAGSLNSTEILLRSEMRGLPVAPALGTKFNGNADFFGLTYNGDPETDVLGYPYAAAPRPGDSAPPGPNIVGVIRYNGGLPEAQQITVEDFSFPNAYLDASKLLFGAVRGEDTVAGNEEEQRRRNLRDFDPTARRNDPNGAMNHSMLYLVMGQDNARGVILFEAPWTERDGRIRISWDQAGQQQIFTRMNEEIRRHARALRGNFISNPTWSAFNLRHLITAHPLGGCPMGDDHLQGAVDPFGRVFAADGSVHEGLYVADGSVIPNALGVNPFLTISALTERFVERKIRQLQGEAYPEPKRPVSMTGVDPLEVVHYSEAELEALFRRCPTMEIDVMVNEGGEPAIDLDKRTIRNDAYWKGFFPKGNVLNAMSAAIFTGFKKEFHKEKKKYTGVTSDTDGRIRARNSLEMVEIKHKQEGTLEAGRYILLRYLDFPWQGFYDIFKVINEDLLIGRVYMGDFPNGTRLLTFPMTRHYGFAQMTVENHRAIYAGAAVPTAADLQGVWRMDVISNANHASGIALLKFDQKPDGRLEASYQLMGLLEGLVVPSFLKDHFQLIDFTPFHDEIRKVTDDFFIGRYVTGLPPGLASVLGASSLGIFHTEADGQSGFYYLLSRTTGKEFPTSALLRPFLDTQLPDGISLAFDEKMEGWFFPGQFTSSSGRAGDQEIAARIPASGPPQGGVPCSFLARIVLRDINEFVDGYDHEAQIRGNILFDQFEGQGPATFAIIESGSRFRYLRINAATGEAEMEYSLLFQTDSGRRFVLEGRKYMQKDNAGKVRGLREILQDYTTLYCHVYALSPEGSRTETGTAYLKFRTFEDLSAVGSLAGFLTSFQVTGTKDPLTQFQAQMRFLAFTAQFVLREYDPLSPDLGWFAEDVHDEVLRGAETPDYFSTRPATELQAILRQTPTRELQELLNTKEVRIDFEKKRIFRDSFWKGSFASDSLLGWEERIRTSALGGGGVNMGHIFAGGSFWKRFDAVQNGVARGHVVNYELQALPGLPEVRTVAYPDNNRPYFKKDDPVLLLTYTNDPYRIVYDTIKVIDDQNALGVMHLGTFPHGVEFASFVMARNNYPFRNMSVADHHTIFSHPRVTVPSPQQLEGNWKGYLIFLTTPDTSLMNQASPAVMQVSFHSNGQKTQAKYRLGLAAKDVPVAFSEELARVGNPASLQTEIRMIDADTLLGRWALPDPASGLPPGLSHYLESKAEKFAFYFLLERD